MEKLTQCPICVTEGTLRNEVATIRDHSLTGETFSLSVCAQCGVLLTNPRPSAGEIGRYYDFRDYISHSDDATGIINRLYQLARRWTTSRKISLINSNKTGGQQAYSLLDYGCGTGYFLNEAKKQGWNVSGVEVNQTAREAAQARVGNAISESLSLVPGSPLFEAITLWHVLEHVHELDDTVNGLIKRLKPGGTMYIAVPNPNSADAQWYTEAWAAFDVPRHLYHFPPSAIQALMDRHKMRIVKQIAQPLDAFYIGLLSEKYRKGKALKGVFNGLRSNLQAWKSGNYSSLIYVVKHQEAA